MTASRILICCGILFLLAAAYFIWERTNPNRLSFETFTATHPGNVSPDKTPVRVAIPGSAIDLPIVPATITAGTWQTTTQGVSFLTASAIPGEQGNSVLYGHNWSNILGNLPQTKPGDSIIVTFANHTTRAFIVQYTATVTPDQTHIIEPTADTRLTIYTCTGFFDTKRFVVVAQPVGL